MLKEAAEGLQDQHRSMDHMYKAFKQQVRRAKLPFVDKLKWEFCALVALLDDLEDNRGEVSLMMVLQRKASMGHRVDPSDFEHGNKLLNKLCRRLTSRSCNGRSCLLIANITALEGQSVFLKHSLAVEVRAMNLKGVAMTSSMLSDKYVQSWGHGPHDERVTRHLNALSNVSSAKLWGRNFRRTFQIDYRKMGDRASMSAETLVTKVRDGRAND